MRETARKLLEIAGGYPFPPSEGGRHTTVGVVRSAGDHHPLPPSLFRGGGDGMVGARLGLRACARLRRPGPWGNSLVCGALENAGSRTLVGALYPSGL